MSAPLFIKASHRLSRQGQWYWQCRGNPFHAGYAPSQPEALAVALAHCRESRGGRHD